MTYVDWSIKGPEVSTCNCDWGCPCQFNAMPTHGDCRAAVAMRIDEGHFGDVDLAGVIWAGTFAWPGAIHEGNGESQVVIDDSASEAQRSAILTILSGAETEPGATIFNVFSTVLENIHKPLFLPITFEADVEARTGRFAVDGIVEASTEPIRNPITGDPHRVRVTLPDGFEYHEAEYCSSTTKSDGPVLLDWSGAHGLMTVLHMTPYGPVR